MKGRVCGTIHPSASCLTLGHNVFTLKDHSPEHRSSFDLLAIQGNKRELLLHQAQESRETKIGPTLDLSPEAEK